jgi:hypothetical protein
VLAPVLLIFWQSFLNAPFFNPVGTSGSVLRVHLRGPDFWTRS